MLTQFHNAFAHNPTFIFLLANQIQRHAAARAVAIRVKTDPESFKAFAEMVANKDVYLDSKRQNKIPQAKQRDVFSNRSQALRHR